MRKPGLERLALDILKGALPETLREQAASLQAAEWDIFVTRARSLSVAPLLYYSVKRRGLLDIFPECVRKDLHQFFLASALLHTQISQELSRILTLLNTEQVPAIVLKGASLAEAVYEFPALRPMSDIDILVRRQDMERTALLLESLGYVAKEEATPEELPGHIERSGQWPGFSKATSCVAVEIHWTLEPPRRSFPINLDEIWGAAQPATLSGVDTLGLSPEDMLIYACSHAARHDYGFQVLRTLCDIRAICEKMGARLDWKEVVRRARDRRVAPFVHVMLRLAQQTLSAEIPEEPLNALGAGGANEEALRWVGDLLFDTLDEFSEVGSYVAMAWNERSITKKAAVVWNRLFPPQKVRAQRFARYSNRGSLLQTYVLHLVTALAHGLKSAATLIGRRGRRLDLAQRVGEATAVRDWVEAQTGKDGEHPE